MLEISSANRSTTAPDISFIVPVRNDAAGLRRCLDSIRAQRDGIEIVVADNGSTDTSAQVAQELGARVLSLPGLSISAVRNRAAKAARGRLLAFIDADMQLAPGWLAAALRHFDTSGIDAAGADYSPQPQATWVQHLYNGLREHRPGVNEGRWLASGNMVVTRTMFERLGGFDETLQTCEDWDFCMRLKRGGGHVLTDSAMASIHFGDPATLGKLFRGETWRGRDNLRVSLRGPVRLRDVPSILFPMFTLACVAASLLAVAAAAVVGVGLLAAAPLLLAAACLPSVLRAVRLIQRPHVHSTLAGALLVSIAYDAGRAAALVLRVRHRRADVKPILVGESA